MDGRHDDLRPIETYAYDISGRLIGVIDANGNQTLRLLLAGSGHGGDDPLVTQEYLPDGGVTKTGYDGFGNARRLTDQLNHVEQRSYDAMDRLTQVVRPTRNGTGTPASRTLTEEYRYDELGQRTQHWNSLLGNTSASLKELTDYDLQGRVVKMADYGNNITTWSYAWNGALTSTGLGDFGGWTKQTINSAGLDATETTDYFGRLIAKSDYGDHVTSYTFDLAGRLADSTTTVDGVTETVTNRYYNGGQLAKITNVTGSGTVTSAYDYDKEGNRTKETQSGVINGITATWQSATAGYDSLNRLVWIKETATNPGATTVGYEYDAVGNIRHVLATYDEIAPDGTVTNTNTVQDYWYKYDAMNRFTTVKGVLSGAPDASGTTIVRGTGEGRDIGYDAAGQRISSTQTVGAGITEREEYEYTEDGYLKKVWIGTGYGAPAMYRRAEYERDMMGRVEKYSEYSDYGATLIYTRSATYNTKSEITQDVVTRYTGTTEDKYTSNYSFGLETAPGSGVWTGAYQGVVTHISTVGKRGSDDAAIPDSETTYTYEWWDGAQQASTAYRANVATWVTDRSDYHYDPSGDLKTVSITDVRPRTVRYVTDASGQILQRDEIADANGDHANDALPSTTYYHFGGLQYGEVSNNGTNNIDYAQALADRVRTQSGPPGPFRNGVNGSYVSDSYGDFDQSYDAINPGSTDWTSSRYTVRSGDTLGSIAQSLWGDESLWYMIADVNGLSGSEALAAGRTLTIPNKVHNFNNNSDTFRPYDPNEAIGDNSPTPATPKPKKKGCGALGAILLVVIAVVITVILKVPITNLLAYGTTAPLAAGTASAAALTAAGVTTVAGAAAAAGTGAVIAGAAIAGAIGSIVSQGVGVATGIQDRFSFKGVALAALGAGIGAGLSSPGAFGGAFGKISAVSEFAGDFAQGAVGNALTQSVAITTGLQKKFDWTGVAIGGVVSGAVGAVGGAFEGSSLNRYAVQALSGTAGAIAGAAARSLIEGSSFGDNVMAALPDVIGATVGNLIGDSLTRKDASDTPPDESDSKDGEPPETPGFTKYLEDVHHIPRYVQQRDYDSWASGWENDDAVRFESQGATFSNASHSPERADGAMGLGEYIWSGQAFSDLYESLPSFIEWKEAQNYANDIVVTARSKLTQVDQTLADLSTRITQSLNSAYNSASNAISNALAEQGRLEQFNAQVQLEGSRRVTQIVRQKYREIRADFVHGPVALSTSAGTGRFAVGAVVAIESDGFRMVNPHFASVTEAISAYAMEWTGRDGQSGATYGHTAFILGDIVTGGKNLLTAPLRAFSRNGSRIAADVTEDVAEAALTGTVREARLGAVVERVVPPTPGDPAFIGPVDLIGPRLPSGRFSISDWSGYPVGVPRPQGPFRLVEGLEYDAARSAANNANAAIRRNKGLVGQSVDVHEIQPVKFGGSATDSANKVVLSRDIHRQQVTPWWNQMQKDLQR